MWPLVSTGHFDPSVSSYRDLSYRDLTCEARYSQLCGCSRLALRVWAMHIALPGTAVRACNPSLSLPLVSSVVLDRVSRI